MTDIEPALTATEWQNLRTNTGALNVMFDSSPWGRAPEGNHFREMAIANWKLPDDDPRKITRDDAVLAEWCGTYGENPGWMTYETAERLHALARKLAALLPPE